MGIIHIKHFQWTAQSNGDFVEQCVCVTVYTVSWKGCLFQEIPFLLETSDKLRLFRLEYLADIFSKTNKMNLSLQEKQLVVFVANDKIQKNRIHNSKSNNFPILFLKTFLMRLVVILTNVIFWHCIIEYINIEQICIMQWTSIFQNDQCMLQYHAWVEHAFKKENTNGILM